MRTLASAAAGVILLIFTVCKLSGQAAEPARFEVASIRPSKSVAVSGGYRLAPGGRFIAENLPLRLLITSAFRIREFQLSGGPGWIDSTTYDIAAKADGDPSPDEIWKMVQDLLEDRFKLKVRHETTEQTWYSLSTAKVGLKLPESTADCEGLAAHAQPGGRGACGNWFADAHRITGIKISMHDLTEALSEALDRPVIDKTGVAGSFDVRLEWTSDDKQAGPSIFTALQEQLGLKLESHKGPVEMLVVEHVERPSEN